MRMRENRLGRLGRLSGRPLSLLSIRLGPLELPVRGRPVRGAKVLAAVTAAFGEKYPTPASRKWVTGFAEPARVLTTLEFVPG